MFRKRAFPLLVLALLLTPAPRQATAQGFAVDLEWDYPDRLTDIEHSVSTTTMMAVGTQNINGGHYLEMVELEPGGIVANTFLLETDFKIASQRVYITEVDSGWVVVGTAVHDTNSAWRAAFVLKMKFSGVIEWLRLYHRSNDGSFIVSGVKNAQAGNDEVIVSGTSSDPSFSKMDFWAMRLDTDGELRWINSYDFGSLDVARALDVHPDGGHIMLAGYDRAAPSKIELVELDPLGNVLSGQIIIDSASDFFNPRAVRYIYDPDPDFVLIGSTSYLSRTDMFVMNFPSMGAPAWGYRYGYTWAPDNRDIGNDIVYNGINLIAVGTSWYPSCTAPPSNFGTILHLDVATGLITSSASHPNGMHYGQDYGDDGFLAAALTNLGTIPDLVVAGSNHITGNPDESGWVFGLDNNGFFDPSHTHDGCLYRVNDMMMNGMQIEYFSPSIDVIEDPAIITKRWYSDISTVLIDTQQCP